MEYWSWLVDISRPLTAEIVPLALLFAAASAVYFAAKWWLVSGVRRLVRRSEASWDDALVDQKVFTRLAHIAPAFVVHHWIPGIVGLPEGLVIFVQRVMLAVMMIVAVASLSALLTAINDVYSKNPEYRHRPIKGYVQIVKMGLWVMTAISVVSVLLDKSPLIFLSGVGAMTAVLLLVFRDTILSLVASVQIASNDMIHVGDWVEMPQCGADGDVVDIALHTVKIQNWDKTITTVPTHRFIEEGFKNWRGMSQSGGRRIKRSVYIDAASIRFLTPEEVGEFQSWSLISDYIQDKQRELSAYNASLPGGGGAAADLRQLTNVGTFRAYIYNYLRNHPKIHHQGFTLLVRQLPPGPEGLPIELYCFSNDQDWVRYEDIQSDIFDHLLAVLPNFDLRLFQSPTGQDLASFARGRDDARV